MDKVLIANRGEIACRIMRTCRRMGMATVSLYTPTESDLPHACQSDQSYCLGDGTLHDTYLNGDKIISLALKSGAKGIHPGYGFLSENGEFAEKVRRSGLIFIGPTPSVVKLMGDKKASKLMVEKLGVPILPGYHGNKQTPTALQKEATRIGFPLLIKAAAGGGGKGMRIVFEQNSFLSTLESARREAQSAFGDSRIILEKYVSCPRHIEVQVLCDSHGNALHLFERECSIQRRYQKILEESPSPALSSQQRQSLYDSSLIIARHIQYEGVGTVEFILDEKGNHYFLEMNTRLQVEHPVTEMITGLDLVQLQIKVARGEALGIKQDKISLGGHAIEVRLCAENPDNNFYPTGGTIARVGHPKQMNCRLDSGYRDGNTVTTDFDPLLAKLISWGRGRQDAIETLSLSLEEVPFLGLTTNRDYLKRVLSHPQFLQGNFSTDFVEKHQKELQPGTLSNRQRALAIAGFLLSKKSGLPRKPKVSRQTCWNDLSDFRNV